jgi:hypothetical protein
MKHIVVLPLFLISVLSTQVAAQEGLEFTLEEVDGAHAPPRQARATVDSTRAIGKALGAFQWGMSKADLIKLLKAQIRAEFEQRIKIERDIMRQDALYQEAQDRARRISENLVSFDGQKTGWDVSPIASEFTHGNREEMLVVTGTRSRDMYFFIQGKLWKWFRELPPDLGGADSEETLGAISARFGAGKPQRERRDESSGTYPGTTWSDGTTRVTALRRGSDVCLIFEDLQTLEHLAVLRHHVDPKANKTRAASAVDSILLSDAEREARR